MKYVKSIYKLIISSTTKSLFHYASPMNLYNKKCSKYLGKKQMSQES